MKRTTVIEAITILTLSLFLYAAISKIMDYAVFKEQLAESPLLSFAAKPIVIGVPIVEFALVILLAVPRWRLKGLYASLVLLAAFTIYIIVMMTTSDHLPCSCGGLLSQLSWKAHIFFNGGFILLNAIAIRLEKHMKRQNRADLTAAFV